MEILTLENLSFTYPDRKEKALDNITFSIKEGEFTVVCGRSGCGKTTLLKLLKKELSPYGEKSGEILFMGKRIDDLTERESASDIGYVLQSPEAQIVTDKVWHELAFGLESLGCSNDEISLRVAEISNYFGIDAWFRSETSKLSGGQKQILNLASVMAMSPKILLLDEPTSQLDPISATNFINTLYKINRELGITVILVEHRLEEVFSIADRVIVMENGKIIACDTPRNVCNSLAYNEISVGFPSAVRIFSAVEGNGNFPLTVKEGREYISEFKPSKAEIKEKDTADIASAVSMKNVWFRYERNLPDILRGVSLDIKQGEIFSVLGANGAGKTTMLKLLSGIVKAYRGKTSVLGKNIKDYKGAELHRHNVAMLPQNVQSVFLKNTVSEDMLDMCRVMVYKKEEAKEKISTLCEKLGISDLKERHPYDLSGGEMQKCALAKVLLTEPKILLLDEPTKGIDAYAKLILKDILDNLKNYGITIIIVTHDVEFSATVSNRCALFFDGEILSVSCPQKFFSVNRFYTTSSSRISRGVFDYAVTVDDVVRLAKEQKYEKN